MGVKLNSKITIIALHILIWAFLLLIPNVLFSIPGAHIHLPSMICIWLFIITTFYINYYVLLPNFLTQRKFLYYALSLCGIISLSIISVLIIDFSTHNPLIDFAQNQNALGNSKFSINSHRILNIVTINILFIAVGTSIKITEDWFSNEKIRKEMENQKLSAELFFLKSQINPHFFFNTLNSIYSLAIQKSDKTPDAIMKLSELMRYIIYESDKEIVPLKRELEYIKNYIELQRLRLMPNVKVTFAVEGNNNGKMIEPLMLLPFIENAFKHGVDYIKDCNIKIQVSIKTDFLFFVVENPNVFQNSKKLEGSSGVGLANSKKRLNLLYPENYTLSILPSENLYRIELMLKLKNNELYHSR